MATISTIEQMQEVAKELSRAIGYGAKQFFAFKTAVPSPVSRILISCRETSEPVVYFGDKAVENGAVDQGSATFLYNADDNTLSYWQRKDQEAKPELADRAKLLASALGRALCVQVNVEPRV